MISCARRDAERLADLLRSEHRAMADFLLALAEFDRARAWVELGHASLWAFLHRDLGLSAGAAFQRKVAAGLLQRFAAIEAPLRDGRLCLSSVAELARVLTPENQAEVLPRFFRLSAREAKEVAAALAPSAVVPARDVVTAAVPAPGRLAPFRTSEMIPTHPGRGDGAKPALAATSCGESKFAAAPSLLPEPPQDAEVATHAEAPPPARMGPPTPDSVEPLDVNLRRLHITVSRRFLQKLAAVRAARSHAEPDATTEALLEEALDLLLAREAKRREAAADRPRAAPAGPAGDRIAAHVRREVWARDGGRCQWPLESGGVCGSTVRLELDHVIPRARGGPSTAANLRLLCAFHNAEAARRCFGDGFMAAARRRERAPQHRRASGDSGDPPGVRGRE